MLHNGEQNNSVVPFPVGKPALLVKVFAAALSWWRVPASDGHFSVLLLSSACTASVASLVPFDQVPSSKIFMGR